MKGKIIKNISNDYTIISNNNIYICKPRGKFRNDSIKPLVGDIVTFDEINKYILKIEKRKNELIRPSIANIDTAVIVTSVKKPDFDTYLLDKTLTIISFNNIEPIIYFTKLDLLNNEEKKEINKYIKYYKDIGYIVASNPTELMTSIKNKTVVFTGQSGAGKSTLLNKLNPTLSLKTDEISNYLGRGKHTTRHNELHSVAGGLVADTPGFSSLDFSHVSASELGSCVPDFIPYLGKCRFNDCIHQNEPGCAVKEAVESGSVPQRRYRNYLGVLEIIQNRKEKYL